VDQRLKLEKARKVRDEASIKLLEDIKKDGLKEAAIRRFEENFKENEVSGDDFKTHIVKVLRPWKVRKYILNRVIIAKEVVVETKDEKVKVELVETKNGKEAVVVTN